MFGLAAGENLGQRRLYNGVYSLLRVNNSTCNDIIDFYFLWYS